MRIVSFCVGTIMSIAGLTCEFLPKAPGRVDEKFNIVTGVGLMGVGVKGRSSKKKTDESP
jgi:hypothetical protein